MKPIQHVVMGGLAVLGLMLLMGCGAGGTKPCTQAADCPSGLCVAAQCLAETCADGIKNGAETGVDCGGGCLACAGEFCDVDAECADGACASGVCTSRACDPNPCLNGGRCVASAIGYACECTTAWTGVNCDRAAACEPNPCGAGTCEGTEGGYRCTCPAGAYNDGTTCKACPGIAGCGDVACTGPSDARCLSCETGFEPDSAGGCRDRDDCAVRPCGAGTCKDLGPNRYTCECPIGSFFNAVTCLDCRDIVGCDVVACSDATNARCARCADGYVPSGPNGEGCQAIAGCDARPCGSGTCEPAADGGYTCKCPDGAWFDGGTCAACARPERCQSAVCQAATDARCVACQPGSELDGAGGCRDVDDCASAPCGSGTCTDLGASAYACDCDLGTFDDGETCVGCPAIAGCAEVECSGPADAVCASCADGYIADGEGCLDLRTVDACLSHHCDAAATCTDLPAPALDTPDGRVCACEPPLSGTGEPGDCAYRSPCGTSPGAALILTGLIDGDRSGGLPKAIEIYVAEDIEDLSRYGVGLATNGGGGGVRDYSFPAVSVARGTFMTVASESAGFSAYFGTPPTYVSPVVNINGNDAIELFSGDVVIDAFGDVTVDGLGQVWEYTDGFAYRRAGTPARGAAFNPEDWVYSGPRGIDGCGATNADCARPFPRGTFSLGFDPCAPAGCVDGGDGTYACECDEGTFFDGEGCAECAPVADCVAVSCADALGSTCRACARGFELRAGVCEDIDDCVTSPCGPGVCADLGVEAYSCACSPGTFFDGATCRTCTPRVGCGAVSCMSAHDSRCTACLPGFVDNGVGGCQDDDGCADNPCGTGTCVDAVPPALTYICQCLGGSYFDGATCASCDALPNCLAVTCTAAGASTCQACADGFEPAAGGCRDIDDCASGPCGVGTCTDVGPNAWDCNCTAGSFDDGLTCASCPSVTGCVEVTCTSPTNATCKTCGPGFEPDGAGGCRDLALVDACEDHPCDAMATCADLPSPAPNSPSGRTCTCAAPREGSGEPGDCRYVSPCGIDPGAALILTGVIDADLPGGLPKAVEIHVTRDIADLSQFGLGITSNGSGITGRDFTFPVRAVTRGTRLTIASEAPLFTSYFGASPDFIFAGININGDDAVELYDGDTVIDTFGQVTVDGTGTAWEYLDGWAYRKSNTPARGKNFNIADWRFSGVAGIDGCATTNSACRNIFPRNFFEIDQNPCASGSCVDGGDGNYTCGCPAGRYFDGATCVACANVANCQVVACTSAVNAQCATCASGFAVDETGGCRDIDDCAGAPCGAGTCADTGPSSYDCTCPAGTFDDTTTCRACAALPGCVATTCTGPSDSVCTACATGYQLGERGCQDADGCASGPCGTGTCVDAPGDSGTYTCSCLPGTYFDGVTCAGCPTRTGCLATTCTNATDVTCTGCASGYEPSGTGCRDIDDCATSPCGFGTCADAGPGAYDCTCDRGFYDDGLTCLACPALSGCDVATCTTPLDAVCDTCAAGFAPDGRGGCVDLSTLDACVNHPCDSEATCADKPAPAGDNMSGRTCACKAGYIGSGEPGQCTYVDPCDPAPTTALVLTGVLGGAGSPLTKAIELYAQADIANLSRYSVRISFNAGASVSNFALPSVALARGKHFTLAENAANFSAYFGVPPSHSWGGLTFNGDDAVMILESGTVIDTLGVPAVDGTGSAWEYLKGWAYRRSGTSASGTGFSADDWSFSGVNALDLCATTNASCGKPFPLGTFAPKSRPCGSGTCNDLGDGTYTCTCPEGQYVDVGGCAICAPIAHCASGLTCTGPNDARCGTCSSGYAPDGAGGCRDIDDCAGAPCGAGTCVDAGVNAYDCICPAGTFDDGTTCGACTGLPHCDAVTCANAAASQCVACASGYMPNGTGGCRDIDDCASAPCGAGTCTDLGPNLYDCTCPAGTFDDGTTCVGCGAIDHCLATTCASSTSASCLACAPGYEVDAGRCRDIDDCAARPCGAGTCTDKGVSAYDCACPLGFYDDGVTCIACEPVHGCADNRCTGPSDSTCALCEDGFELTASGSCRAVDGCASAPCGRGSCVDLPTGSGYTCTCESGTWFDGGSCVSCALPGGCATSTCTDPNDASCTSCLDGYVLDGNRCKDRDDCAGSPCGVGTCVDTGTNAYDCICPAGRYDDGVTCAACQLPANCVAASCTDGLRSTCTTCGHGYEADGAGGCRDIDDCRTSPCGAGTCVDTGLDSYDCTCPAGTFDDGVTCGACPNVPNCFEATCTNLLDAVCATCATGYEPDGVGGCRDINACATSPCDAKATCVDKAAPATDSGAGRTCACASGYAGTGEPGQCAYLNPCGTAPTAKIVITGIVDGNLTGGTPKAIELYALADIPNLSVFGIGTANTAGTNPGREYVFPATSVPRGTFITVASESANFRAFFGGDPTYLSASINGNGDDAYLLYENNTVIDTMGLLTESGTGKVWEYTDGWAYRKINTAPSALFEATSWTFSGKDALDPCLTTNSACAKPFPRGSYVARLNPCGTATCADRGDTTFSCSCPAGNFFNGSACSACTPVANCAGNLTCTSATDSRCDTCASGFEANGAGGCRDIDDCAGAPCGVGTCVDKGTNSYDCNCPAGRYDDGVTCASCTPIQGCVSLSCTGASNSTCSACDRGYTLNASGGCTPDDDCADDPCGVGTCADTPGVGTYSCTCPSGTFSDGVTCASCVKPSHCASATCTTATDAVCAACASGFELDGAGGCRDIDDCSSNPCGAGSCVDTGPNSYECLCPSGQYDDGTNCVSCNLPGNCTAATCTTASNATCTSCVAGFELNGAGGCRDIDDCRNGPCGTGVCTDTGVNAYDCACSAGTWDTGTTCETCGSLPNCLSTTCSSPTNQRCTTCAEGYSVTDAGSCADVDACVANPCDANATCTDKPAPASNDATGRTCACQAGYTGTGEPGQCTYVDPCAFVPPTKLILTGVLDGNMTGGTPKAVELLALADIPNLSVYAIGTANTVGARPGREYVFPSVAVARGTFITVASESVNFKAFFGVDPTYVSAAINGNGDDAYELYEGTVVIDTLGNYLESGTGKPWDYTDGWIYRRSFVSARATFLASDWVTSGRDALDPCLTSNATCAKPFPRGSFAPITNPCGSGTCGDDGDGTYTCTCPSGQYANGTTCVACTAVANCSGTVTCTSATDSVCGQCAPGYFGANCAACGNCDDSNPCTSDICDGGIGCKHVSVADGTTLPGTAEACKKADYCSAGAVVSGGFEASGKACGSSASALCDAPDTCDGEGGCSPNLAADGTSIEDGNLCNGVERCLAGEAQPGVPLGAGAPCGDPSETACTSADSCDGLGVCLANHVDDGVLVDDDGEVCNGSSTCLAGEVIFSGDAPAGTACGDALITTCSLADSCDGLGACRNNDLPEGASCDDGDESTVFDACGAGMCLGRLRECDPGQYRLSEVPCGVAGFVLQQCTGGLWSDTTTCIEEGEPVPNEQCQEFGQICGIASLEAEDGYCDEFFQCYPITALGESCYLPYLQSFELDAESFWVASDLRSLDGMRQDFAIQDDFCPPLGETPPDFVARIDIEASGSHPDMVLGLDVPRSGDYLISLISEDPMLYWALYADDTGHGCNLAPCVGIAGASVVGTEPGDFLVSQVFPLDATVSYFLIISSNNEDFAAYQALIQIEVRELAP